MNKEGKQVVVVSQHYPPDKSGNASRIGDTCSHLLDKGWEVTVLAPPPAFPHGQFKRTWNRKTTQVDNGVTAHRLWAWQPTVEDPSFLSRMAYYLIFPLHALLWLLFNYRDYDVVITSSPPIFTGIAGLPFGLIGSKPWVVDVRDLWIDASIGLGFISEGGLLERISRLYERIVLQTADQVTVTTTLLGESLIDHYDITEEKIFHLPNGVDVSKYQSTNEEPNPQIIYTGNVGHAQDLEACIRAMNKIEQPDTTFKIVGDGDVREKLERLAAKEGLGEDVEFTGLVPREEIPGMLNNSMVGVAPLKKTEELEYAVPTKVYEYMATELPVVATGVGEIERILEESNGGIPIDNDSEALSDTLEELLDNPELRREFGESGREYIMGNYSRESIATDLSDMLYELIDT